MKAIERAAQHWADRLTEVREIPVPEWGEEGEPLIIHVHPANMAERNKLFKLAQDNDLGSVAETLVLRARDKDGQRIFTRSDRETLMTACDPDVVVRVANAINSDLQAAGDELEEAQKN